MLKKRKGGDEKYYIMISLILGVMILAISLYFIFQEYFTQDELNWETCRQSIILRSGEGSYAAKKIQEGALPFKCKTQVINIDYKSYYDAGQEIVKAMAQCWYTFGEGKLQLYPKGVLENDIACFDCARIHFSESVKEYYSSSAVRWGWLDYLTEDVGNGKTYGQYIYNFKNKNSILENQPWPEDKFLSNIRYEDVYDMNKGDLIITVAVKTGAWKGGFWSQESNIVLIPHQTSQQLKCDRVETIPA